MKLLTLFSEFRVNAEVASLTVLPVGCFIGCLELLLAFPNQTMLLRLD